MARYGTMASYGAVALAAAVLSSAATLGAMNIAGSAFAQPAPAGTVPLLTQPLPDLPGREVRMVLLDRGKFIVSGTPQEMRDSKDALVRQFVDGLTEGPLTDRRRGGMYEDDLLGEKRT